MLKRNIPSITAVAALLIIWQTVCSAGLVPSFMLPSPIEVIKAFVSEFPLLLENSVITLQEAFIGLVLGVSVGFCAAVLMDTFEILYKAFYPLLIITQTVPSVAIAPLLVLWFGYEMTPKIVLIVISTFFPVTVGLLDGFRSADKDAVGLLRSMGADRIKVFRYIKFPSALPQLFSGLRIAAAYSVVGAVISEWLGGFGGLGVIFQIYGYMKNCGLKLRVFLCVKLINGALTAFYCSLLMRLFPQSTTAAVTLTIGNQALQLSHSIATAVILLIMCTVFIIEVDNKRKLC